MQVTVNFKQVFESINNAETLKEVAASINTQLQSAYKERVAELAKSVKVETKKSEAKAKGAPKAKEAKTKTETKKAETKETKTKKAETKKAEKYLTLDGEKVLQIGLTDTKRVKALKLKFVPYSDKCLVITGNTKPIHGALDAMRKQGVFPNMHLKKVKGFEGGFGWLVNKNNKGYAEVCKKLQLKAI